MNPKREDVFLAALTGLLAGRQPGTDCFEAVSLARDMADRVCRIAVPADTSPGSIERVLQNPSNTRAALSILQKFATDTTPANVVPAWQTIRQAWATLSGLPAPVPCSPIPYGTGEQIIRDLGAENLSVNEMLRLRQDARRWVQENPR